jgi:hypothetical protein
MLIHLALMLCNILRPFVSITSANLLWKMVEIHTHLPIMPPSSQIWVDLKR